MRYGMTALVLVFVLLSSAGAQQPAPSAKPAHSPCSPQAEFTHSTGKFLSEGDLHWVEYHGSETYSFVEVRRDLTSIYLRDESRNMSVRLPLQGGWSTWQLGSLQAEAKWFTLYKVFPTTR
jgi:hypothetical protein